MVFLATCSISPYSVMTKLPFPIAVVGHDAGGANGVAHWVIHNPVEVRPYLEGPARKIWEDTVSVPIYSSLQEAMDGAASLLSATSVTSTLEDEARREARNKGIPSVAMLDHWTRYPDRFEWAGERLLPDELWVVDEPAEAEARRCFPGIPIRRIPNFYLDAQVRQIKSFNPLPPRAGAGRILYVLEPIQPQWSGNDPRPKELQAFDFFMTCLGDLGARPDAEIVLRPHPSDTPDKYDDWPSMYPTRQITIDGGKHLAERIAWADWVVGCETFAMVVAARAGRIVMSSLPPWATKCRLPLPEILILAKRYPSA